MRVPFEAAHAAQPPLDVLDSRSRRCAHGARALIDPRRSRIAELRFFAGLTIEESSEVLGVSPATIEREWQGAWAWWYGRLTKGTKRVDA